MKQALRWFGKASLIMGVCILGTATSPFLAAVAISLWLLVFVPFVVLALVVIAFMIYHGLKHHNPFIQDSLDTLVVDSNFNPFGIAPRMHGGGQRTPKLCPICKRVTRCKVAKSKAGFFVHSVRA